MRKTSKLKKIIAIIVGIGIVSYIVYAVVLLIINPTQAYIVTQGELLNEDETVGYIIRDEQVIEDDENSNGIYVIATEGQKVSKDENVFRYYKDSEKEITEKITEIDYQIQEQLENTKEKSSADIKVIENQIENKLIELNTLTNYQEITEYKNNISELISKKISYIGDITENKEIKSLIKERKNYEEQLTKGVEYETAPMSGIISYKVDGLEDKLTPENLANLTDTYLESLDLQTGQIVSSSNQYGKVIDNFKCYIAVIMDSEQAYQAKVGDSVTLRVASAEEVDAEIVQINDGSGKRTIIFETNKMNQNMINYRKISVDVIWWKKTGYKIPNQAIITKNVNGNDLNYVIRNKSGVQSEILIKIVKQTDKFSIISSYTTKELQELGFDETEIKNYKKIANYDEIVLNPEK